MINLLKLFQRFQKKRTCSSNNYEYIAQGQSRKISSNTEVNHSGIQKLKTKLYHGIIILLVILNLIADCYEADQVKCETSLYWQALCQVCKDCYNVCPGR